MGFFPSQILSLALPTAILCSAACWSSLPDARPYREVFGNESVYLDIYYEVNPDGYFLKRQTTPEVRFRGTVTTDDGEYPVEGVREGRGENARYQMHWSQGRFVGRLARNPKGCEPDLSYTLVDNGKRVVGTLRGGFCPGT